jgi:heme exporter protein C
MSAVTNFPLSQDKPKVGTANRTRILLGYTGVAAFLTVFALLMALGYASQDATQGDVQRIFYTHMSSFFGAFVAFSATVIGGVQYLRTRDAKWDTLAVAGVEVGLMLALINLVTGIIWGRPIWNTWWTWDPRLTSAAVMCLTYMAYLMLRNGIDNLDRRRTFASVYGILAISTVIFTLIVIRIRPDTIHPAVIGSSPSSTTEGGFRMPSSGVYTLLLTLATWSLFLPPVLIWWRIRLENLIERVAKMKMIYSES